MSEPLDVLGRIVIEHFRDSGFMFVEKLKRSEWRGFESLQNALTRLSATDCEVVTRCARAAIDHAVHELLFSLHEACERGDIALSCNGIDVLSLTDGLHGELFTDEGWQAKFSRFGNIETE